MLLDDQLLTVPQVAAACAVKDATAWRWVREGSLPAVRLGQSRTIRVRLSALEAFIQSVGADDDGAEVSA